MASGSPDYLPAGVQAAAVDGTAAAYERDSIGNKGDAAPATTTAANGTLSLMAYIKAIWNLLRNSSATGTPSVLYGNFQCVSAAANDTFGSYTQAIASTALAFKLTHVTLSTQEFQFGACQLDIAVGGVGSEVVVASVALQMPAFASSAGSRPLAVIQLPVTVAIAQGSRVALRTKNTSAVAVTVFATLGGYV